MRRGSTIHKRKLSSTKQTQVRVRGRLRACVCGIPADEEYSYLKCAERGVCKWTPWSPPSVLATPLQAPVPAAAAKAAASKVAEEKAEEVQATSTVTANHSQLSIRVVDMVSEQEEEEKALLLLLHVDCVPSPSTIESNLNYF